jgi:hypothetical protein
MNLDPKYLEPKLLDPNALGPEALGPKALAPNRGPEPGLAPKPGLALNPGRPKFACGARNRFCHPSALALSQAKQTAIAVIANAKTKAQRSARFGTAFPISECIYET